MTTALAVLVDLLPLERPVGVLDIGANPIDGDPPYLPLLRAGLADVTGFEPQPEALARLREVAGAHETYLPHVIGDGADHTLHVCRESGFTSLLRPDPARLAALVDFPRLAEVVETVPVATRRLDDVEGLGAVDLLKMDIQGSELSVLRHGSRTLADVVAVQVEVNFFRLYEDQPTFAEIDLTLRGLGLEPQTVVQSRTWPLAPTQWADPWQEQARQLVECDLLYVRDLTRPDLLTPAQLGALALISLGAYGQLGVARTCVRELVRRTLVAGDADRRLVASLESGTDQMDGHRA